MISEEASGVELLDKRMAANHPTSYPVFLFIVVTEGISSDNPSSNSVQGVC